MGALVACGGGDEAAPEASEAGAKAPAVTTPPPSLSAQLQEMAIQDHLVPSPGEMQRALSKAGIETSLSALVPVRDLDMTVSNKDQVAVRTGVILADMLLTVKTVEASVTAGRLSKIKTGLQELNAGSDLPAEIDSLINRINNGALQGDRLLFELDELSAAVIPEIKYEADWILPLLQAGAWLEGANLVSKALKNEGKVEAATNLLVQPQVVNYFIRYVDAEAKEKVDSAVLIQLKKTLDALKIICDGGTVGDGELDIIQSTTASVLELL
jgi:hypothetical protein